MADLERQVAQTTKRLESERQRSQQLEDIQQQLESSGQAAEKLAAAEQYKLMQARDKLQSQLVEAQRKVGLREAFYHRSFLGKNECFLACQAK